MSLDHTDPLNSDQYHQLSQECNLLTSELHLVKSGTLSPQYLINL